MTHHSDHPRPDRRQRTATVTDGPNDREQEERLWRGFGIGLAGVILMLVVISASL